MALMVLLNKCLGKSISDGKCLFSGRDYVDAKALKKAINEKSDITLAEVPYPRDAEFRHMIITGTTGAGKSNVMIELLDQISDKNEKVKLVDTVGTYVQRYYQKGRDIILNPLSENCVPWTFFNECYENENNEHLIKNVEECLVQSTDGDHDFWDKAAQIVFVETEKQALAEEKTTGGFLNIPLDFIEEYLNGTYGHSLMSTDANKMALSIRATLINSTSMFDILKESPEEKFSIKEELEAPPNFLPSAGDSFYDISRGLDVARVGKRSENSLVQLYTEQYVLQELQAAIGEKNNIFYWMNDRKKGLAEVDFLLQYGGNIIPIEAKASINLKAKSLKAYMDYYNPQFALRTSLAQFSRNKNLYDIPLYLIGEFPEILKR